jgi:hypothetical protein
MPFLLTRKSPMQPIALNSSAEITGRTQREEHDTRIDADLLESGDRLSVGHRRRQERRREPRDRNARRAAGEGERQALRHQLRDQAPPARAKREPDLQLLLTPERPGEQQVADIRAGDQQHEGDRAEQQQQRLPRIADERVAEKLRLVPRSLILLRELAFELRGQRRELGLRVGQRSTRLQASDPVDSTRPSVVPAPRPGAAARRGCRSSSFPESGSPRAGRRSPSAARRRAGWSVSWLPAAIRTACATTPR